MKRKFIKFYVGDDNKNYMRDIKFRAWDKELKKWQYFTLLQLAQGQAIAIWSKLENWCRYTGLKDKNGKKTYEGDIIKYEEGIIQEVKFGSFTMPGSGYYDEKISAGWYLEIINYNKEKENNYYKTICLNNDVEIIGNIYENKDLLACA